MDFLRDNTSIEKIFLVKGNHDNFIARITNRYDNIELKDEFVAENYFIVHGHRDIAPNIEQENIIVAHEHPSIGLYTDIGVKEKIKCFVYGEYGGKRYVVLPAMSYFAQGSDINIIPKSELLSPVLKKIDIDRMKVKGIEEGKLFDFPEIGKLRLY